MVLSEYGGGRLRKVAWFGIIEDEKIHPFVKDAAKLAEIFEKIENGEISGEDYGKINPPEGWDYKILRKAAIIFAKKKLKSYWRGDVLIIEAVRYLEDINDSLNLLYSRLRSWYSLYSPETSGSMEEYARRVIEGRRAKESLGWELEEEDLDEIKNLASVILNLLSAKRRIEEYIDKKMREIAPNLREICGSIIGGKLISLAGGLEKLAFMPASTIQVLGAEKALFSHIRKGSPPPKHGIIYQHPLVHNSPKKIRGRVARSLAAKISIAARLDLGGKPVMPELKENLLRRVEELRGGK